MSDKAPYIYLWKAMGCRILVLANILVASLLLLSSINVSVRSDNTPFAVSGQPTNTGVDNWIDDWGSDGRLQRYEQNYLVLESASNYSMTAKLVDDGLKPGNVLASILASVIIWLVIAFSTFVYYLWRLRAFTRFFGKPLLKKGQLVRIVLDTYELDRDGITEAVEKSKDTGLADVANRPFIKRFSESEAWRFPGPKGKVLGYCSARGLAYLSAFVTDARRSPVAVTGDDDSWASWKATIISIGGPAASKHSRKILEDYGDFYVGKYKGEYPHGIHRKSDGAVITDSGRKCYGLIAKFQHPQFPEHRLIVCAGIDEWGTSGACWYLSENWRDLYKRFGTKDFEIIVEVDEGSDETAHEVTFEYIHNEQQKYKNQQVSEEAQVPEEVQEEPTREQPMSGTSNMNQPAVEVRTPAASGDCSEVISGFYMRRGNRAERRRKK